MDVDKDDLESYVSKTTDQRERDLPNRPYSPQIPFERTTTEQELRKIIGEGELREITREFGKKKRKHKKIKKKSKKVKKKSKKVKNQNLVFISIFLSNFLIQFVQI